MTGTGGAARVPDSEFRERRDRVADAARREGLDGILVVGRTSATLDNMGNVHWLTRHYNVPPLITPTGPWASYGQDAVIVTADGRSALVTVGVTDPPVIDDVRTGMDVERLLVEALRDLGLADGRVGLAGSDVMPFNLTRALDRELPGLALEPRDLLLAQQRVTLSPIECDLVREAAKVGCEILEAGLGAVRPGATDGDVVAAGWQVAAKRPHTRHWDFIIGSGQHVMDYAAGSLPSWDPTTPYAAGDMTHPDCFGYVDGYMYDVQRTVVAGREPTADQSSLIDGCTGMVEFLGESLHDGVTCREVHSAGHGYLAENAPDDLINAWGDTYDHFGHGFTSGFDWPFLGAQVPGADEPLRAPFAVTIELWWGREGVGAALVEDEFLVLPDGVENLTAPHLTPWREFG